MERLSGTSNRGRFNLVARFLSRVGITRQCVIKILANQYLRQAVYQTNYQFFTTAPINVGIGLHLKSHYSLAICRVGTSTQQLAQRRIL